MVIEMYGEAGVRYIVRFVYRNQNGKKRQRKEGMERALLNRSF